MSLVDFLRQIDEDVRNVLADDFEIEITNTQFVPSFSDPFITYDNLTDRIKKCKLLRSCVLYIDIRNSAKISVDNEADRLAKMYSAFVKNMISAARYYNGHIRNIIGDRIMVVFDRKDCFKNAFNTAILMNSISQHIIAKNITGINFSCGIGIDFGEMLIVKTGAIRRGAETEFYRGLVWLGRPANVASRLTDLANKSFSKIKHKVHKASANNPTNTSEWVWHQMSASKFLDQLEHKYPNKIVSTDPRHANFFSTKYKEYWSYKPILMTADFYRGLATECPENESIKNGWITKSSKTILEYDDYLCEADVIFTESQKL